MTRLESELITIDQIVTAASKLRAAGVLRIKLGELELDLSPAEPEPAQVDKDAKEDVGPVNPLFDRETFGGRIPGMQPGDAE